MQCSAITYSNLDIIAEDVGSAEINYSLSVAEVNLSAKFIGVMPRIHQVRTRRISVNKSSGPIYYQRILSSQQLLLNNTMNDVYSGTSTE